MNKKGKKDEHTAPLVPRSLVDYFNCSVNATSPVLHQRNINPEMGPASWAGRRWQDPVTENPPVESTEIWEFYNITEDAHPMHIHAVSFELVDRQPILVDEENKTVQLAPGSEPLPPSPWELGPKDTIIAFPAQVTRVRMTFTRAGQYVWHCHILEHEDNDMMAPYRIGHIPPHQP